MPERWLVRPGEAFDLSRIDPASTDGVRGGKDAAKEAAKGLQEELRNYQERLWAESRSSLLIVLQGMDTCGKDGTIEHVFGAVNPQGIRIANFKAPTPTELAHDFLWRVHNLAPAAGEMVLFNRSHYEDVLVVRVLELVPEEVWRARYDLINDFEALLDHKGTTVVKLFLHISKDEQRRRLEDRLQEPDKRWKFKREDLDMRARWAQFMKAYQDALEKTSSKSAPWYVIPADHKWYRNWAVSRVLVETLKKMDPRFPDVDPRPVEIV